MIIYVCKYKYKYEYKYKYKYKYQTTLQEGQEPDTFQQSATLRRSRRCRTDKARPVRCS